MSARFLLEVASPGFFSSIQDLGRPGLAHLGVSAGGAADPQALKVGNRLVGNEDGAAAIEMTFTGGSFRFLQPAWVAIAGGHCQVTVDGFEMATWYSFKVEAGQRLHIGSIGPGARAYLCVHGGFEVPPVLGSRSTFVSSGWGGLEGRSLASGDLLQGAAKGSGHGARQIVRSPANRRSSVVLRKLYSPPSIGSNSTRSEVRIRVTRGPQAEWFDEVSLRAFFERPYVVTSELDRKGVRLEGPALALKEKREMLTEGVCAGVIQVPGGGQPIVLGCESRTTGGYPKIANVIRADLFWIGQLSPGCEVSFEEVDLETAWALARGREEICRVNWT